MKEEKDKQIVMEARYLNEILKSELSNKEDQDTGSNDT